MGTSTRIGSKASEMPESPYPNESTDLIYDLLFCDSLELFEENYTGERVEPWTTVFADDPDLDAVEKIAADPEQESRVRMLAYNLIRENGRKVPEKVLLGTIIEINMPEGNDTLAVYPDGRIRYINYTGKMAIFEDTPDTFQNDIEEVLAASRTIVGAIGPWDKERLPPPGGGNVRMTFLVSDGLYFGEGPMAAMQQDALAAPLIDAATSLFLKIVDVSSD